MRKPGFSLTRRRLLGAGSTITLIAVAGIIWRGKERGVFSDAPREAYSPWDLWNAPDIEGTSLALAAAGILAASPHNTQPWIFRISDDRIELYADTSRNLGAFDPYLREMHIGLGCVVETMMHAAGPNGYRVALNIPAGSLLSLTERGPRVLVATLALSRLSKPAEDDALYQAIPRRHTNRGPYERARGLPASAKMILMDVAEDENLQAFLFDDGDARARFDSAVIAATQEIIADREMEKASGAWMRESPDAILEHRDGLNLDTAGLAPWLTVAAKLLPSVSTEEAHKTWLAQTRDSQLPTAPLTGLIAVRDRYDRAQSLAAGRAWARMQLAATSLGFAMQPINQPIETIDRERQLGKKPLSEARLADLTGDESWQPTFAFRAGYAAREAPESPRRSLKSVTL